MWKLFISFILLIGLGWTAHFEFRSPEELQVRIFEKIFTDMFRKRTVNVFLISMRKRELSELFRRFSKRIRVVQNCMEADIVLVTSRNSFIPMECSEKIIFSLYRDDIFRIDRCVGAFYWRKGRPHIVFVKEKLQSFNIVLPPEYEKFIESLEEMKPFMMRI